MSRAFVSEIYESVQGEGPFTGERQIFVRLAGCPLRCRYCDTPASLTVKNHKQESVTDVLKAIFLLSKKTGVKTVSFTGGEPLQNGRFLEELMPLLKKKNFRLYLETAGIHVENLKRVERYCDTISMDVKLPSATGLVLWPAHKKFLAIGKKKIFVKVVLDNASTRAEVLTVVNMVASLRPQPLLVWQPVTPTSPRVKPPSAEFLSRAFDASMQKVKRVLVMPQQHKIWAVR